MGYILATTAIFLWSINLLIANYFADTLTPFELAFGRWFIAVVVLLPFTIKSIIRHIPLWRQHWQWLLWLAITGIVLNNTLIYYAGQTTSVIDMGLLDVTGPLFIMILSWIWLKSPVKILQIIGLLLSGYGVVLIITNGDIKAIWKLKPVIGNLWMLLNCFIFAVYSLLQSKRPVGISQSELLSVSAFIGVLILLPLMLYTTPKAQLLNLNLEDFGVLLYLGISNSVIAFLAWNTALNKIGNIKTGIIYYTMPLFSGIESCLLMGEVFNRVDFIGGLFIIGGIICTILADFSKKKALPLKKKPS